MKNSGDRRVDISADGRWFLWKTQPSAESRPGLPSPSVLLYYLDLDEATIIEVPARPISFATPPPEIEWVRCGNG